MPVTSPLMSEMKTGTPARDEIIERHTIRRIKKSSGMPLDPLKIGADVPLHMGRQAQSQEAAAATDLQNRFRAKGQNPFYRVVHPPAHLWLGNRLTRIAAVPAINVECRIGGCVRPPVVLVPDFLPM